MECETKFLSEEEAIVKIESALLQGARKYFMGNGFTEVVVPHITHATGACENVNTLFEVDYFGKNKYLVQTGQLYLESFVPKLDRVFCVGPSFRAEKDVDNRHLTEFTLIEIELMCNLNELIGHIEKTFMSMVKEALNHEDIIKNLGGSVEKLKNLKTPFKKVTYTGAIKELNNIGIEINWGDDLKSRHEKTLCELYGNKPFFITHYPEKIKFFNMKTNKKDSKIVNSTDFILPNAGECVGAAEREYEYEKIFKKLKDSTMLKLLESLGGGINDFEWYLNNIKKNGQVPHAGCGFGLNRITQYIIDATDIRKTTGFPLNKKTLY